MYFFFNDTATTEIYTLSLHDALPICAPARPWTTPALRRRDGGHRLGGDGRSLRGRGAGQQDEHLRGRGPPRSEEHTSELQSRQYLVCRLLLETKKPISRLPSSA